MFESRLTDRNIKPTTMRLLVLKALVEVESAISLKDLEAKFDRADKATLFRTLKTFEENKLIHRIDDGTGSTKYALCEEACECAPSDQHVHFHCENCGETFCLSQTAIPETRIPTGFRSNHVNMVFHGKCANCS